MIIRIGTRGSKLAVAQAKIVKEMIFEIIGWETEIITKKSLGDKDLVSPLPKFRGQGAFTSTLEQELQQKNLDLNVHSLKDLPVEDNEGLEIIAYIKRHNPGDSLLIKKEKLISKKPLKVKKGVKIATGSTRRQSQFLAFEPTAVPVDIRGNVNSRIKKLQTRSIDALIMASAVFERITLSLPENIIKIDLPLEQFPAAPGQGIIAVQVRKNEFSELKKLDHSETRLAAEAERKILSEAGGGCELSLGITISLKDDTWQLFGSKAQNNWNASQEAVLTRYFFESERVEELVDKMITFLEKEEVIDEEGEEKEEQEDQQEQVKQIANRKIVIARGRADAQKYSQKLLQLGAITASMEVFDYQTNFELLQDEIFQKAWKETEWLVLSSQRTTEFLSLLSLTSPHTVKIAVIGTATAKAVRSINLPVHIVADGSMESLRKMLSEVRGDGKVLYLRGVNYSQELEEVISYAVYEAKIRDYKSPFEGEIDDLVVFSRRAAESIIERFGSGKVKRWVAIGKKTGDFLEKKGKEVKVAEEPTPRGVVKAILGLKR
ncbi:MAG: hydroxymethylbilane synthase [Candidatus Kariarchaeaceae archaeon]